MTAQRIPLSELKEWMDHLSIRPFFAEATRRQKLEAAVARAQLERSDATEYLEYQRMLAAGEFDPAPVTVPATESEQLPW